MGKIEFPHVTQEVTSIGGNDFTRTTRKQCGTREPVRASGAGGDHQGFRCWIVQTDGKKVRVATLRVITVSDNQPPAVFGWRDNWFTGDITQLGKITSQQILIGKIEEHIIFVKCIRVCNV